jgi:hypothetical protein
MQIIQFQTVNITNALKAVKKSPIKTRKKSFVHSKKVHETVDPSIARTLQKGNRQGVQRSRVSKLHEAKPTFAGKKEQNNGTKGEARSYQRRKIIQVMYIYTPT